MRFYQNFIRLPVLGKRVARLAMPGNAFIAHEDRRVVITQQAKASGQPAGLRLVKS